MLGFGGELVTLLVGDDAPVDLVPAIEAHIATRFWSTEVVVYQGGQRADLLQLGVE